MKRKINVKTKTANPQTFRQRSLKPFVLQHDSPYVCRSIARVGEACSSPLAVSLKAYRLCDIASSMAGESGHG